MSVGESKEAESAVGTSQRTIMPPYLVLQNFLDDADADGLLAFARANESAFMPTGVGPIKEGWVDLGVRSSLGTRDLGPYRELLKGRLKTLLGDLFAALRLTPVDEPKFELQLIATNDGGFYKRHIDTATASDRNHLRVLSGVYYVHARPKAFAGGALRLYAIGRAANRTFVDVEPEHNSMLVFPSWAPHEVRPVTCPSHRFADSRFSVNCWMHRRRMGPNPVLPMVERSE